uniref:Uncharacterized protein n=1 Tax=Arion vulgaris TaxID=1028688 RepID=A0A0B7BTH1_9EUPU
MKLSSDDITSRCQTNNYVVMMYKLQQYNKEIISTVAIDMLLYSSSLNIQQH